MPIYKAPVDDVMFLLNDVFQIAATTICRVLPTPRPT